MEDLRKSLHEHEKKVLLALKKEEELSQEQLAHKTGLPEASIAHTCLWLYSKGLIDLEEKKKEFVELNTEGEQYLEEGLPERQALRQIKKGVKTVKKLKEKLGKKKSKIALTWLMKKKLIRIHQGKIELTEKGEDKLYNKTEEEKTLALLKEKKPLKNLPDLGIIEERGELIKKTQEITRKAKITGKGRKITGKGLKTEKTVNVLTHQLIKTRKWEDVKFRPYNIKASAPPLKIGKKHPYLALLDDARDYLTSMGFVEIRDNIIVNEFQNFDALYQPGFHPARSPDDTYYLENVKEEKLPPDYAEKIRKTHENGWKTKSRGWKYTWDPEKARKMILRTHTTVATVKAMAENEKEPAKYFTIARNFRRDVIDSTHLPEFYQCEGIIIEKGMTFRELLGILKEFSIKFAGTKRVTFRPAYFPYTEPSVELVANHPELGSIELGGAGMFRPEVRLPTNTHSEVMAWGLGFDRLAMTKLGIKDIRELFSSSLEWLENTPLEVR